MKLRCLIVAVIMLVQMCCTSVFAQGTVQTEEDRAEIIGSFDFDSDTGRATRTDNCEVTDIGGEHKSVLALQSETSAGGYFLFDKTINSGKLAVGYDICSTATDKEAYVRMFETTDVNDAEHMFEAYIMRTTGVFQMFNNTSWNVDNAPTIAYKANEWYHLDMWFDFEKRTAEYYINGELLGSTAMAEGFDEIRGFVHRTSNGGGQMIDNVYAVAFIGGGNNMENYPYIMSYPLSVEFEVVPEINIPNIGHIYWEKDIDLTVDVTESIGEQFTGKVKLTLCGDDGKLSTSEKEISLQSNEKKEIEFNLSVSRYGFYDVSVECISDTGKCCGSADTRLSTVAKSDKMNPKIGFSDHTAVGDGYNIADSKFDLIKNVGGGTVRDENIWTSYEKQKGILEPDEYVKEWWKVTNERGQNKFIILGYHFPGRMQSGIPRTAADISAFDAYVSAVVEDTKDMDVDYEIWNEPNASDNIKLEDYITMVKRIYPLIKKINPDAKVYIMATANLNTVKDYVEDALKAGLGDYCDGITIHPYNVTLNPEQEKQRTDIYDFVDMLEKYGLSDKEIVFSEYGYTTGASYIDEESQANYFLRSMALYSHIPSRIYWYCLSELAPYKDTNDGEKHFGFIRSPEGVDITNEAKPALLAFSNYNRLMTNADFIRQIEHSNEDVYMQLFKNEDAKNTIIAWSAETEVKTALKTQSASVTICDRDGNEQIVKPHNGVLELLLTNEPIYIIADDLSDVSECQPEFDITQGEINVVANDTGIITGCMPKGDWEINVDCPNNMEVTDISNPDKNGNFKIHLKTSDYVKDDELVTIAIKDRSSGNTVFTRNVSVVFKKALSIETSFKYYKNSHWRLAIKLSNNKKSETISGKIAITNPNDIKIKERESTFENLEAGGTRYIYINIPLEKSSSMLTVNGYAELSDGEIIPFEESTYFVGMAYLDTPPVIDGKISTNEYVASAPVRMNTKSMIQQITDWGGVNDLSATVYLNYDKDFFYLAARVRDNREGATESAEMVWANDSIQFAFAEKALISAGRTEIGIGKDNEGNSTIQRYSFWGTKFWVADYFEEIPLDERCELKIAREGQDTIYELRMPWVDIYGDASPVFTKRNILFSIIVNDNDGNGRRGWIEFCPGIGGEKNAAQFMKVPVI